MDRSEHENEVHKVYDALYSEYYRVLMTGRLLEV